MSRVSINRRILTCDCPVTDFSGEPGINLSDTVFEFLSEEFVDRSSPASSVEFDVDDDEADKENENENDKRGAEDDSFWETQHQLLQDTICRTSSLESRIRCLTKGAVREAQNSGDTCACGRNSPDRNSNNCRKCLMEIICRRLQSEGFNGAICKSKWRSSPDIPSGEHTFLDVIDNSNPKKGEIRVIIELNFRAEFEMARANEEYNNLIKKLPEIFVGKIERLLGLLKILCGAAKKCMKEKKMHMGPWRKHRYMQAKWFKTSERFTITSQRSLDESNGDDHTSRVARPRRSMLTVDLMMESYSSSLHRPVVEVV